MKGVFFVRLEVMLAQQAKAYREHLAVGGASPHGLLGGSPQRGCLAHLPVGLQRREVIHCRELDKRREHEGKADGDEPVHGRSVGHLGQGVPGADAQRCHGKHRGDAWVTENK